MRVVNGTRAVIDKLSWKSFTLVEKIQISHNTAMYVRDMQWRLLFRYRFALPSRKSKLGLPIGQVYMCVNMLIFPAYFRDGCYRWQGGDAQLYSHQLHQYHGSFWSFNQGNASELQCLPLFSSLCIRRPPIFVNVTVISKWNALQMVCRLKCERHGQHPWTERKFCIHCKHVHAYRNDCRRNGDYSDASGGLAETIYIVRFPHIRSDSIPLFKDHSCNSWKPPG